MKEEFEMKEETFEKIKRHYSWIKLFGKTWRWFNTSPEEILLHVEELEQENDTLRRNLRELALNPSSFKSNMIKAKYEFEKAMEDQIWAGEHKQK